MGNIKTTYVNSYKKKKVREVVFSKALKKDIKTVIGLGGPDIDDYLNFLKKMGITKAEVYEKDPINIMFQLQNFAKIIPTQVIYGDIINAPFRQHVLYDLDFTCTLNKIIPYLEKFKRNAIITVSLRGCIVEKELEKFRDLMYKFDKKKNYQNKGYIDFNQEVTEDYKLHIINFFDRRYYCYYYYDKSPMVMILKVPN